MKSKYFRLRVPEGEGSEVINILPSIVLDYDSRGE